ncbi:MAG TPA: ABC transporter substrate-binding protein [Stellaceae bacterium]|nr:ABC transporter substrate-binding protein [Stellaceae bacterium]
MHRGLAAALAAALVAFAPLAGAKTFRFANDGDVNSMDPYARNETFLLTFVGNIYEPLVGRDKQLKAAPMLATSWSQTSPEVWRFKLRQGVKFHDGTPFTADDVLFSFDRVRMDGSNLKAVVATVKRVSKIDDYTVDMTTDGPDPILPEELTNWYIMSKSWTEKNNAVKPADLTKNEDFYASRHANGTGPFMLKDREPEVKTTLVNNPNWWGKPEHNLTEVVFTHIGNDATRVAALLSGEIDMMYTVPPQDIERIRHTPHLKIYEGPELRTIFLGMDQARDELIDSNVKGKNPFKDVRVRKAFYLAIDEKAIKDKVMRGSATITALMVAPGVNGFDKSLNQRYPYDPAAAKKLLVEAGYPNGFEVGMDCPTDRYINDEAICQAVVAMLSKIGVKVNLLAQTRSKYFAKILGPGYNTSFYLLGWTPTTYDAHNALFNLIASRSASAGTGLFNVGGYSNKRVDELTRLIQIETDPEKRQAEISEAMKIHKEEFGHIPLHQQTVVWAARDNIELVQLADNFFPLRYVRVK